MSRPSLDNAKLLLKKFFGFDDFRGRQGEAISAILNGDDVFVMMPTGGGKSLCYQLPALTLEGTAIVISPLIALMKNQVDALRSFADQDGVAHVWNSSLTKRQMVTVRQDLAAGVTKLLYMAPESLNKRENIEFLKTLNVSFYAIDEAHCISEWGHDFRPEYRQIKQATQAIGDAPIIALTATATPKVMSDILKTLDIPNAQILTTSFNRANLYYAIEPKVDVVRDLVKLLLQHQGKSAIVYCMSRKSVEKVAESLQINGIKALPYHAGLEAGKRVKHQDAWLNEEIDVIVATIAFGMGIDKPDVRLVIHHDMPKSLESYYQETGRAGRDGGEGICLTYYAEEDMEKMDKFLARKPVAEQEVGRQLLLEARGYARSSVCRRRYILHYFGELYEPEDCGQCDNCARDADLVDNTAQAQKVIQAIKAGHGNFRTAQVVNVLVGQESAMLKTMEADNLAEWGSGKDEPADYWDDLVGQMSLGGLLVKDIERYGILEVTDRGHEVAHGNQVFMALPHRDLSEGVSTSLGSSKASSLDPELFSMLKSENQRIARSKNIPPYALFSEAALQIMATTYPITEDELKTIPGVGESKARRFGASILTAISEYVEENDIQRPGDFAIRSSGEKSALKLYIIQSTDRKQDLEGIASNKNISVDELIREMELIVQGGTKLDIQYVLNDYFDEDSLEELIDYFTEDSETGSIEEALEEFDDAYNEEELRLARLHFLSKVI